MLVLVIIAASCLVTFSPVRAEDRTIVVPDDYPTIESAIGNATDGNTIFIKNGTYEGPVNQTLVIDEAISIVGEKSDSTIINLQPAYNVTWILGTPIFQYSDSMVINANDVKITNLTMHYTGLIKANGDRLQIIGNNITTFTMNSFFLKGSNCNITNNSLSASLNVKGSSNFIKQNIFDELTLQSANQNFIESNAFQYLKLYSSNKNVISGNSVSARYGLFAAEIDNSNNNCLDSNYINGLSLSNSNDNSFAKNNITSSIISRMYDYNIEVSEIDPTMLSSYSIALVSSNSSIFCFNTIANVIINDQHSHNNMFYANSFVGPALNDGIVRISNLKVNNNFWDNGSIGNYWSDYLKKYPNASEISNSGIGNTPYVVSPSYSEFDPIAYIDHFPLIHPFSEEVSKEPEPFPTAFVVVVSAASVALVGIGLLVYFKKRKHQSILSLKISNTN